MAKRIVVTFAGDTSNLDKAFARVKGTSSGLDSTLRRLAGAAAFGAVTDRIYSTVNAASDLEEALNKSSVVFGQSAGQIDAWAQTASEGFGLSRQGAIEAAATFGNMFDAMGLGAGVSEDMSKNIVELAADLASFNNIDVTEATERLRSGLLGEQEAVERLGINMSETRLKAKALAMGMGDGKKVLDATTKAQAAYAIILEDTTNAQGDFDRTSDSLANQQRILGAEFENLKADIGEGLMPAMQSLTGWLVDHAIPAFESFIGVGKNAGGTNAIRDFIGDITGFALAAPQGVLRVMGNITDAVGLDGAAGGFRDAADEGDKWRAKLHANNAELFTAEKATDAVTKATDKQVKTTKTSAEALKAEQEATDDLIDSKFELRSANLALDASVHNLAAAQKAYNDYVATGGVDVEKLTAATDDLVEAQNEHAKAAKGVAAAQEAVNEALKPPTQRQIGEAARDVAGAQDDLTIAQINQTAAQDEWMRISQDATASQADKTRAWVAANAAARAVAEAEDALADAIAGQTEVSKTGTTASDAYKTATADLAVKEGELAAATDKVTVAQIARNTAMGVAEGHETRLWQLTHDLAVAQLDLDEKTWGAEKAMKGLNTAVGIVNEGVRTLWGNVVGFAEDLALLPGPVANVAASRTFNPTGRAIPGLAGGGPVRSGGAYMVGELGPEVFVPGRSGTIVPNGAGDGGVHITITGAIDPASVARQIRNILNEDVARGAVGVR